MGRKKETKSAESEGVRAPDRTVERYVRVRGDSDAVSRRRQIELCRGYAARLGFELTLVDFDK